MQPHSTETMTERTTGASPPLSQSVKRKREEENEEDAGSSSSKLCELWTADGGVCRDIWRTHVVKYLNRSDRKFLYSVNKGTRIAMKELHSGWYENYFKQPFRISDLSSISTLEVAWENYDFTKANARGHFIREAAATGDVQLLRWVREEKGVDRRMQKIVESAVKSGHLNVVQYCARNGWNIDKYDFVRTAAEFGRLDIVRYLHEERGIPLQPAHRLPASEVAAKNGKLEVLKYLHEMNIPWDPRVAAAAASNADPNFECLKFCVANGCAMDDRWSMWRVIRKGDLQLIKMVHEAGAPWYRNDIEAIYSHARSNRFNILKYCVDNGLELDERACKLAVEYNDLKGLQYLREKGAPWDASLPTLCAPRHRDIGLLKFCLSNGCPVNGADACAEASEWGGLEHLKYLRNEGCQWDQRTTQYASRVDILRYAVENGCPVNGPEACAAAVRQGSIEKLIYLRKSGYNWDARTSFEAAAKSYLDFLKYCIESGCPVDETSCANAAKCNKLRNLKYLKANNAPWDHRTVLNARRKDILKFALDNGCPKPPSNAF